MSQKEAFLDVMFTAMEEIEKRSKDSAIRELLDVIMECQMSILVIDAKQGLLGCDVIDTKN